MSNGMILFTGVSVFSLMLIAMVLTVLEFRQMKKRRKQKN